MVGEEIMNGNPLEILREESDICVKLMDSRDKVFELGMLSIKGKLTIVKAIEKADHDEKGITSIAIKELENVMTNKGSVHYE